MYLVLRAVIALMMTTGGAALVALLAATSAPSAESTSWMAPIRRIALFIAIPLIAAAITASALLPRRRTAAAVNEPGGAR